MKLVLLSGGSGKRLWPLSNDSRSKQFLKVLQKEESLDLQSMVQRVWDQLTDVGMIDSTVIATGKGQVEMIHSQLGNEVSLIIEPERRDTFPAIALSAAYLYSIKGVQLDEVIGVLPVDPYVDVAFFHRIKELENLIVQTGADLALLGVKPTFPSSKYGYIVPKLPAKDYIEVSHFKEKPDEEEASSLINNNALWNCGVFAFRLGSIIKLLESIGLPLEYGELSRQYSRLPKGSFDYEVVEKAQNIVALPYDGDWKDLGTWNTLTEEMADNKIGNGNISKDSINAHLINELEIPINILGLSNIVVVASPDGILVSDKKASPRVKEMLSDGDKRPMFEERRWGYYKVLDYTKFTESNQEVLTKRFLVKKNHNISYHKHYKRQEVWTIVKGSGLLVLDGVVNKVETGEVVTIPANTEHAIKALEDLEVIEVQTGTELIEEDIVRLGIEWEDLEVILEPIFVE